jgi:hypothetical protein
MPPYRPLADRFWDKVDRWDPDHCWLWTGARADTGYGSIGGERRSGSRSAHRLAYELMIGPIPEAMTLDHLCSVRQCVNPKHLEAVTLQENLDRSARYRCSRGHDRTEANTYIRPDNGRRMCRDCSRVRDSWRLNGWARQALRRGPKDLSYYEMQGEDA